MTALPVILLMTEEEVAALGRVDDAGFGALRTERGLLPLTAMNVDARVAGVVVSIEVAQTFVNTTSAALEATYIFPLPDRAAVCRFRMEVGGRAIDGVLDERAAAREQYEEAIAAGHRAAITEEDRPGVFTLRVGNLMPGETATVRLSLVGPLPVDDGEVTFRFPLVVAPRYMPGVALDGDPAGLGVAQDTSLVPDASRISPPVRLPGCPNAVRLGLRVTFDDRDVTGVASSLHATTTTTRDAYVVDVQPGERLDRDFILRWRIDPGHTEPAGLHSRALRSSLLCVDDADGRGGSFMVTLVPPSTTAVTAKPRDVVFVVDRSGSMDGWKMVAARRAAARMIDTLTSRDRFCTIAFDDDLDFIPAAELVTATDRNRFRAVEALARLDARGGTEMAEPLRRAAILLAGGHDDRERVVVLVTDGQVGDEDHILRELVPSLKAVRMFTLGIDQAVNAAFLRRLASAGGGLCELVESEDRLDAVMAKVHRRIGTPIATEITIRAAGLELERDTISPNKLPDLHAGAPVVIFGRYRGPAPLTASIGLEATSLGDPLQLTIARADTTTSTPWLAACWARARIRDLEDRYATGAHELEGEIVRVSKRFGVLSRFTAFLAVDRSQVARTEGRLHQVVQPVEPPRSPPGLPGRAGGGPARVASTLPVMIGAPMSPSSMPAGAPPPMSARSVQSMAKASVSRARPQPSKVSQHVPLDRAETPVAEPIDDSAYRTQLSRLSRELEALADARAETVAIRVLRQRLAEWIEDVRSVGGHEALAIAVARLVERLSAALATITTLVDEVRAVAVELARLASGATPPNKSRLAFWK